MKILKTKLMVEESQLVKYHGVNVDGNLS